MTWDCSRIARGKYDAEGCSAVFRADYRKIASVHFGNCQSQPAALNTAALAPSSTISSNARQLSGSMCGFLKATSSTVLVKENGARSSCAASGVNCLIRLTEEPRRVSMALQVSASRCGAPGAPGDRALVLVGHDANLANIAGSLNLTWIVDGRRDDTFGAGRSRL